MLRREKDLRKYRLEALDGRIGGIADFFFDVEKWTIRYLVASTDSWLAGRTVLLSPIAVAGIDDRRKTININLTRDKIRHSPPMDTDKPVSRLYENEYYLYYAWTPYWYGSGIWGTGMVPSALATLPRARPEPKGNPRLRSARDVEGYFIRARDDEFGSVEDFIFDEDTWLVRYLLVDTINWWPSKGVLVSPLWVGDINWEEGTVAVDLERNLIRNAPAYARDTFISDDYEQRLFRYYGREQDLKKISRAHPAHA